jgi:hypothetical protein
MILSRELAEASRDYRHLLDRGYPAKATLALVGNRWRLDAEERVVLFRGMSSTAESASRAARLGQPGPGDLLLVDLYNVAFTIVHYLIGKPCFISSDGFLRDAGANYGRVSHDAELARAFDLVAQTLVALPLGRVEAYLDAPVSRSGEHAAAFRTAWARAAAPARPGDGQEGVRIGATDCAVEAVRSADGAIVARLGELPAGQVLVASSDSAIIDRASRAFDLALHILSSRFPSISGIPVIGS